MAITAVDKIKLTKYLNAHAMGDIYYLDMCDVLERKVKPTYLEFLEYFTNWTVKEFQKEGKVSIKFLTKLVSVVETLLGWCNEGEVIISNEILDKIRNLKNFYYDYLSRTNEKEDLEFVNNSLNTTIETIERLYPSINDNESIVKYVNQIANLEREVKTLKRDLREKNKLYDDLKKENDNKITKIDTLNQNVSGLSHELETKIEEIKNLEKTIEGIEEQIQKLQNRILELGNTLSLEQGKNNDLMTYKEQYEKLVIEVNRLKEIIEKEEKKKIKQHDLEVRHGEIEEFIYQKLLLERVSIDDLLKYINAQGFKADKDEIASLLKRIRNRINIDSSLFSMSPTYKIVAPNVLRDKQFNINIPKGCKYYDIMLVSDFHIRSIDHKILFGMDLLNDYCVKNNIHLILNLGDFYHGLGNLDYESAIKNHKIIEQSILKLPSADGLYHAILGGNHDKNIIKYGFDPIELLSNEREDFINLGYTHSTIALTGTYSTLGKFDIHHPDIFDFPIDLDEDGIDSTYLNKYLNDIYAKQSRNRNDSYIDIFGHTHKSQFNYPESYYYIPSMFDGQMKRGVCHLRIYFDDDTKIKYMVFMPLNITNQLVKNNEIVYKKIMK